MTSMPAPSNSRLERVPTLITSRLVVVTASSTLILASVCAAAKAVLNLRAWILSAVASPSALSKVTLNECAVPPLTTCTSSAAPSEYLAVASAALMLAAVMSSLAPMAMLRATVALAVCVRSAATNAIAGGGGVAPFAAVEGGVAVAGPSVRSAT